jgi:hypothetical protein
MEKQGVIPDVAVEITPEDWAKGTDPQLGKAVEVVAADVTAWKKAKAAAAGKTETAPAAPTIPTAAPMAPMPRPAVSPAPIPAGIPLAVD